MLVPKVSIILPVYNSEEFLDHCLTSLTSQTLLELEILAINDGSTDNSGSILEQYAASDSRIRVFHQDKKGQASARNLGLNMARGEYIGAVDSDDWVERDMFSVMYSKACDDGVDIVLCGWNYYRANQVVSKFVQCVPQNVVLTGDTYRQNVLPNLLVEKIPGYFWNKLYRRELVENYGMRVSDMPNNSDWIFACQAFTHAQSLISFPVPLYNYRYHNKNQLLGRYRDNYFSNLLKLQEIRLQYSEKWQLSSLTIDVQRRFLEQCLSAVNYEFLFPNSNKHRLRQITRIVKDPTVRAAANAYKETTARNSSKFLHKTLLHLLQNGNAKGIFLISWIASNECIQRFWHWHVSRRPITYVEAPL